MDKCPSCGSTETERIFPALAMCSSETVVEVVPRWNNPYADEAIPRRGPCGKCFTVPLVKRDRETILAIADPFDRLMTAVRYLNPEMHGVNANIGRTPFRGGFSELGELCPELVTAQVGETSIDTDSYGDWHARFRLDTSAIAAGFAARARNRIPFDWTESPEGEWVKNWRGKNVQRTIRTNGWTISQRFSSAGNLQDIYIREDGTLQLSHIRENGKLKSIDRHLSLVGLIKMADKLGLPRVRPRP